jgi:transposase
MRPGPRTPSLSLTDEERRTLAGWAAASSAVVPPHRAAIILACADGQPNRLVARTVGVTTNTVGMWRRRFLAARLEGLRDVPRRPGVRPLSSAQVEEVLRRTIETRPEGGGAWSTGRLAAATGLSQSSVSRIWRAFLRDRRQREVEQSRAAQAAAVALEPERRSA